MSQNNYSASVHFREAINTTLGAAALSCIDTVGRLVNAADTADYRFAGVNQNRCVALATGLSSLGKIAQGDVYLQGMFIAALTKGGTNPTRILDPVYALSATAVQDVVDAVNDVYVGRILKFLRSADPVDYKDDTVVTASCYVLVGYDAVSQ